MVYIADEHNLSEFCHTIPSLGDMIVNPMVSVGLHRQDFNNRRVLEFIRTYFMPLKLGNA